MARYLCTETATLLLNFGGKKERIDPYVTLHL
jgi:hypothetical protein